MTLDRDLSFRAYASKKQAAVVIASLAPMISIMTWVLVLNASFPIVARIIYAVILLLFALVLVSPLRGLISRGPILCLTRNGIMWQSWSHETIPWAAVERWRMKSFLGITYLSVWLNEAERYPAARLSHWTYRLNHLFKLGQIAIPCAGMNRGSKEIEEAFAALAPRPPLPTDPRLARRLARARRDKDSETIRPPTR